MSQPRLSRQCESQRQNFQCGSEHALLHAGPSMALQHVSLFLVENFVLDLTLEMVEEPLCKQVMPTIYLPSGLATASPSKADRTQHVDHCTEGAHAHHLR